jgi:hypothetical protein
VSLDGAATGELEADVWKCGSAGCYFSSFSRKGIPEGFHSRRGGSKT